MRIKKIGFVLCLLISSQIFAQKGTKDFGITTMYAAIIEGGFTGHGAGIGGYYRTFFTDRIGLTMGLNYLYSREKIGGGNTLCFSCLEEQITYTHSLELPILATLSTGDVSKEGSKFYLLAGYSLEQMLSQESDIYWYDGSEFHEKTDLSKVKSTWHFANLGAEVKFLIKDKNTLSVGSIYRFSVDENDNLVNRLSLVLRFGWQ